MQSIEVVNKCVFLRFPFYLQEIEPAPLLNNTRILILTVVWILAGILKRNGRIQVVRSR